MIISELAKQVSNEHLFYLIAKAARYGYHIHEEFIEEFDRRADHYTINSVCAHASNNLADKLAEHINRDFSEVATCMIAHAERLGPSRMRKHVNIHGTVTGRFPSRPNIDSSLGIKLDC